MNFFDKMREKSEAKRRGIALLFSFLITAFIFVFWIAGTNVNGLFKKEPRAENLATPVQLFMKDLASVGEVFKDSFGFFEPVIYEYEALKVEFETVMEAEEARDVNFESEN